MPGYSGTGQAKLINYNQQRRLWVAETVAAGASSIAVQLRRIEGQSYPWGCAFEITFSGAPGVFEVDAQTAETDTDANYVTVAQLAAVNASNVGRIDLTAATPFFGKFVRLHMTALANAVTTSGIVTR